MGTVTHHNAPIRAAVTNGKTRICVAGFKLCPHTGRAKELASLICSRYPGEYEEWFYFDSKKFYYFFLEVEFANFPFHDNQKVHDTSAFILFEKDNTNI